MPRCIDRSRTISPALSPLTELWHNQPLRLTDAKYLNNMEYKTYMCVVCGFIYDEEKGWPDDGIAPGTRWEDVPAGWECPECGAGKNDFEMVEI